MPLVLLLALLAAAGAAAQDGAPDAAPLAPAAPGIPECRFCVEPPPLIGTGEVGLGWVSTDSRRFGDFRGWDEEGLFGILGARLRYFGPEAAYLDLSAERLPLDARSVELEAGRQGRYALELSFDGIPHGTVDAARTPFRGLGSEALTLPPGWVRAGSTAGMAALDASLRPVFLDTQRERWRGALDWLPASGWTVGTRFRHETKEGLRAQGGSFVTRASLLPVPVNYTLDDFGLSVSRASAGSFTELAYAASFFRNGDSSVLWDNPYTGPDRGRLALAPDNEYQQVTLASGWRLPGTVAAGLRLAAGVGKQDDDYVPVTEDPGLTTPQPRGSLDGEVRKLAGQLRVSGAPHRRLRLSGELAFDDRENRTPRATYAPVVTDSFADAPEGNVPYSFERRDLKLRGDLRLSSSLRLSAGARRDARERDYQQRSRTDEDTAWTQLRARLPGGAEASVRYGHGRRDGSRVTGPAEVDPPENPAMRQFHLADRARDDVSGRLSLAPLPALGIELDARWARDDYDDSPLGLQEGRERHVGLSMSHARGDLVVHGTAAVTATEAGMANSDGGARWTGASEDTTRSLAIGASSKLGPVRYGSEYAFSRSTGAIAVDRGVAGDPGFPDLRSRLHSLRAYASLPLLSRLAVRGDYVFERFEHADWALDGVEPGTIANVLSLGQGTPRYEAHAVMLSLELSFGPGAAEAGAAEK